MAVLRGPGEIGIPRPLFSLEGGNRFFLADQKEMVPEKPASFFRCRGKRKPQNQMVLGVFLLQNIEQDAEKMQNTPRQNEKVKHGVKIPALFPQTVEHRAQRIGHAARNEEYHAPGSKQSG